MRTHPEAIRLGELLFDSVKKCIETGNYDLKDFNQILKTKMANLEVRDAFKRTLLIFALDEIGPQTELFLIIKPLIENGIDVKSQDDKKRTAALVAIRNRRDILVINEILSNGGIETIDQPDDRKRTFRSVFKKWAKNHIKEAEYLRQKFKTLNEPPSKKTELEPILRGK